MTFGSKDGSAAKAALMAVSVFVVLGIAFLAYRFWDYKENNPKFCVTCHLMTSAYSSWEQGEHAGVNCHECHRLSLLDQNRLLVSFVLKKPATVPVRHGKTIVPSKYCSACHWQQNPEYPQAAKITNSPMHATHFFRHQIECSTCHGYILHRFTPEPRFCVKCHQGKAAHGATEGIACMNCHTDRTLSLKPDRLKCLFCHGDERARRRLAGQDGIDIRQYKPEARVIQRAVKIKYGEDSPMQFACHECHRLHNANKLRPPMDDCLRCHRSAAQSGKHRIHVETLKMGCTECHAPHIWRVEAERAKKDCSRCHPYKSPKDFF